MQRSADKENLMNNRKIFKAARKLIKCNDTPLVARKQVKKSDLPCSPTPKKSDLDSPSVPTQQFSCIFAEKTHGKRGQPAAARTIRCFQKTAESKVEKRFVRMVDSEDSFQYFNYFEDGSYLVIRDEVEQAHDLDDFCTSGTQIEQCKVYLERELIEALRELE